MGLAGPDSPGEGYLEKVARLNSARLRAEEIVLNDLVWLPAPDMDSPRPDPWGQSEVAEIRQENENYTAKPASNWFKSTNLAVPEIESRPSLCPWWRLLSVGISDRLPQS